jgi:hypothetical protein
MDIPQNTMAVNMSPIAGIPDSVWLNHVVPFLDRSGLTAFGYDVDACLKWRIPPLSLFVNPGFAEHLGQLRRDWLSSKGVKTVTADDVMISFVFMHWGGNNHSGFVMHTVCYRAAFDPKVWRVDRFLRYYRYYANGEPTCLTTQTERRGLP